MRETKLSIIFASIGIVLVCLFMILSTYAYFTVDVKGEGNDILVDTLKSEDISIVFNDTSNVSLVNAYTGDEIVKNFTVENISDYSLYYDIKLNNVVNNFENKDDLVYKLESDGAAYRNTNVVPSENEFIASNIMINKGQKHTYTLTITFLKTNADQTNNMNKTFSSNISVLPSKNINVGDTIYKNYSLGKYIVQNSKGIENEMKEDGIYYTNSSVDGKTIYYYRGSSNLNNNLIFKDYCFKILRTTSDNGIRIVYYGKYENEKCIEKPILDELSSYNIRSNYNAYVGYMYGSPSSDNYKNEHENINSSTIKNNLEKWYADNFKNSDDLISYSSIYCNDRKPSEFIIKKVLYDKLGYGKNNSGYNSYNNIYPTYDCSLKEDRLSVTSESGSDSLNYPIGLITLDELKMAGFLEKNNFLHSKYLYYTMTPAYFNGSDAYVFSVDKNVIKETKVTTELGIRPVLTLNKDIMITSGDGSINAPFKVK